MGILGPPRPTPRRAALVVLQVIGVVVVSVAIALWRLDDPSIPYSPSDNPSPFGYTRSLVLFVLPTLYLMQWFFRNSQVTFQKRAFATTLAVLIPIGFFLDLLFGNDFFCFKNSGAVIGWAVPARGGPIPIEEFLFYITGFTFVLLLYIWADEYWMGLYNVPDYRGQSKKIGVLLRFHKESLAIAAVLLLLAAAFKTFHSGTPGFPRYFAFLLAGSFVPSAGFYRSASGFINWRAFHFSFLLVLLISLIWEVTLALPYEWWNYQPDAMMGIRIKAWSKLPLEAVFVWLAVTYTTVIIYETVKIWQASGRNFRDAFFGRRS